MSDRSTVMVSGTTAAVLFTIGYFIVVVIPGGGEVTEQDFTDYYGGDPNFFSAFLLLLALLAGSLAMVWFFTELRVRLPNRPLAMTAYGVSLVGSGALAIGGAILFGPAGVQMNSEATFVGAPVAHTFAQAGLGIMRLIGMCSLALAVGLFSVALRRAEAAPTWLS